MDADGQTQRRSHLTRWIWIGYWAGLFVVMHRPLPAGVAPAIAGFDKVAHFTLYALLAVLGGRHARSAGRRLSVPWILTWAAVYAAYAALDEWLQPYVGRTASLGDWAADVAGIAVGTLFIALWKPARGRSETAKHPAERYGTPD